MDIYSVSTVILLTFSTTQDIHSQEVIEQNIPTGECHTVLAKYRDSYQDGTWKMYICRENQDQLI